MSVDLPLPEGPQTTTTSPLSTLVVQSMSTWKVPYHLLTPRISIIANVFVRNGIRVYAYRGMTHVKAAIYDGWACLGSANFDKLSLQINLETDVATSDPGFVARLRSELFERDFADSREITEARPLGWSTYLSSFVARQL